MEKTPRDRREELERSIADLRSRIDELDAKSGTQVTLATRVEIEREAGQAYARIHREVDELEAVNRRIEREEDEVSKAKTAKASGPNLAFGVILSTGLLALAVASDSWAVFFLSVAAAVRTVVGRADTAPQG